MFRPVPFTPSAFSTPVLKNGESLMRSPVAQYDSRPTTVKRSVGVSKSRSLRVDVAAERGRRMYVALDAADVLSRFMGEEWPDEDRFSETILDILAQVPPGARVRAFGEMVALLWARGSNGATVRLEHLWDDFCRNHALALFCAYPRIGPTRDLGESFAEVCALHSRVLT